MMIDWCGSLFRPKTAIEPMLIPNVGPKSVSGIQVGPAGSLVRKLLVFQTPPLAPAAKTVLPDVSEGSTASELTRPASPFVLAPSPIDVGPTAVHDVLDCALAGAVVKIRKLTVAW